MPTSDDLPSLASVGNPFLYIWNLGYRRLCPIIPPDAELDPDSNAAKALQTKGRDVRGKAPGVLRRSGQWTGFNWLRHDATEQDLVRWNAMGAGVGILTGQGLVAIDIDTRDREAAKRIHALATEFIGAAPLRFGNHPKALLLCCTEDEDPIPYAQVRFTTAAETDPNRPALVEIATEGRQFVAHGPHPCGKPYTWAVPLCPRHELPLVTRAGIDKFLAKVAELFPGAVRQSSSGTDRADVDQEQLRGDPDLLDKAINHLPNNPDAFPTRNDYVRMGAAIKAAYGPDHEDRALEAFEQWCARWPGGDTTPAEDWARLHAPFEVGAQYVYDMAAEHGGWVGQFFQPIGAAETDALDIMPKPKRTSIEILDIDDVLHMPDPKWLVARHVPECGFGLLYGEPGCGKSFLALDMALHIAYGLPDWHGDALTPREGAGVLYIAGEGASGFKQRINAWRTGRILPPDPRFSLIRQPLNFMDPTDVDALIDAVMRHIGDQVLDFIVVDTVSRAIPGADENLQKDMTRFVNACEQLRTAFGAAVLGVHHVNKQGDMRGSTVFSGQADYVLHMAREKAATTGQIFCRKQKDGPDGWHDSYRLQEVAGSLVPVRLHPEDPDEAAPIAPDLEAAILGAMSVAWEQGNPWAQRSRGRRKSAVEEMERLFSVARGDATAMIDRWVLTKRIEYTVFDGHAKALGYRPVLGGGDSRGGIFA